MSADASTRSVIVLGSTGSIGTQTLDVLAHLNALHARGAHGTRYEVVGLAAGGNVGLLAQQAAAWGVRSVACAGGSSGEGLAGAFGARPPRVFRGVEAAEELVRNVDADLVVAAIVGSAGLPATLAAVELGRDVALANKETLVAAGGLVAPAARASGSRLLPVDSEHSALWQALQGAGGASACVPPSVCGPEVTRVILTASGGALRHLSREAAYHATMQQALAHPTWSMGAKVTLDSASLTNKAFEVIEAHWLFGLESARIGVLIHPQSIVHSMVEYADGSVLAQLGSPDMRTPIQYAVTYPERPAGRSAKLDLRTMKKLDFDEPDLSRFPALALAYRVIDAGGTSGAVFNAASEEATLAFLAVGKLSLAGVGAFASTAGGSGPGAGGIAFGRIPELAAEALDAVGVSPLRSLSDALEADAEARRFVRSRLGL